MLIPAVVEQRGLTLQCFVMKWAKSAAVIPIFVAQTPVETTSYLIVGMEYHFSFMVKKKKKKKPDLSLLSNNFISPVSVTFLNHQTQEPR